MAVAVAALGSHTIAPVPPGSERWVLAKVTFDSTYPSGGEPVTAAMFGLNRLDAVFVHGTTLLGRWASFDAANSKIQTWKAYMTENDTADISADSVQVIAIGV